MSAAAVSVSTGWCLSVVRMGSVSAQMMLGAMMRVRIVAAVSAVRMVLVFMVFSLCSGLCVVTAYTFTAYCANRGVLCYCLYTTKPWVGDKRQPQPQVEQTKKKIYNSNTTRKTRKVKTMSTTQHETTTPNYLEETSTHGAYALIITAKPVPTRGYKTTPNQITYEVVAGIQDKTHATRNLVSLEVSVEIPNKNPEKLRNVSLLLAERASGLLSQGDNKAYAENVAISAEQTSTSYTRYGILDAQVNESTENKKNSKKKLGDALTEGLQGYADALSRDWGNLTPAPASFVTEELLTDSGAQAPAEQDSFRDPQSEPEGSAPARHTPAWAIPSEDTEGTVSDFPINQFEERDYTQENPSSTPHVYEGHPEEGAMKIGFWGKILRFFGVA